MSELNGALKQTRETEVGAGWGCVLNKSPLKGGSRARPEKIYLESAIQLFRVNPTIIKMPVDSAKYLFSCLKNS